MTILAIDLIDNNDGEKTWRGYKFTRNAIVTSPVEQSGRVDDASRIYESINDTGVPDIGDEHPNVASSLLKRIYCESIEPNILTLRLEYETPPPGYQIQTLGLTDISMESSLVQTETTKDFGGANLTPLFYQYASGSPNPANPVSADGTPNLLSANLTLRSELPLVPVYIPGMVLTYKKRITGTDEDELEALNKIYQGAVNNAAWRGYNSRTWLCIGLNWRISEYRLTFFVELRFQYKFDNFDVEGVFKDPYSGKVPGDIDTTGNGDSFRKYRIQPEANFVDLLNSLGM